MKPDSQTLRNLILCLSACVSLHACGSGNERTSDTPLLASPGEVQSIDANQQMPNTTGPATPSTSQMDTSPMAEPTVPPAPDAMEANSQGQPAQETPEPAAAQSDTEMPPTGTPAAEADEETAPAPAAPEDMGTEEMPDDDVPEAEMNEGMTPDDETTDAMDEPAQMENDIPRPDYPVGPNDIVARRACLLFDEPAEPIDVVELERDAGQVLLTPQPQTGYRVQIPASGTGYLALEVPDWAITVATFASFQQKVTILDPDFVTEIRVPLSWNGACPDKGVTDHRLHYHSWGSFTVKIEGEPNAEMTLSFIKQN